MHFVQDTVVISEESDKVAICRASQCLSALEQLHAWKYRCCCFPGGHFLKQEKTNQCCVQISFILSVVKAAVGKI